jgi:hypothetical protein
MRKSTFAGGLDTRGIGRRRVLVCRLAAGRTKPPPSRLQHDRDFMLEQPLIWGEVDKICKLLLEPGRSFEFLDLFTVLVVERLTGEARLMSAHVIPDRLAEASSGKELVVSSGKIEQHRKPSWKMHSNLCTATIQVLIAGNQRLDAL